jgi:hypothetical protein
MATGLHLRRQSVPRLRIAQDETIPESPSSRPQRPRIVRNLVATKIICRNNDRLDVEILKTTWHPGGPKQVKTNLGVQQHRVATAPEHEVSEAPDSRPQKLAHDVGAVAQNWQHVGPNGPPFDSRGIGGADDSAHRRAGDWLRGESPLRLRLLAPRHGQFLVRHRLQARSLPSADEHLVCDRGFRPQRLLFAFSAYRPPTNIASAESLRPFYAIHGPVCSPLRFSNIAAERSNR